MIRLMEKTIIIYLNDEYSCSESILLKAKLLIYLSLPSKHGRILFSGENRAVWNIFRYDEINIMGLLQHVKVPDDVHLFWVLYFRAVKILMTWCEATQASDFNGILLAKDQSLKLVAHCEYLWETWYWKWIRGQQSRQLHLIYMMTTVPMLWTCGFTLHLAAIPIGIEGGASSISCSCTPLAPLLCWHRCLWCESSLGWNLWKI